MNYAGPGTYRHYKGGMYEVLGLALQENTVTKPGVQIGEGHEEVMFVIYRPLTPGSMLEKRADVVFWARELSDFNAQVPRPPDARDSQPRFVKDPTFEAARAELVQAAVAFIARELKRRL